MYLIVPQWMNQAQKFSWSFWDGFPGKVLQELRPEESHQVEKKVEKEGEEVKVEGAT